MASLLEQILKQLAGDPAVQSNLGAVVSQLTGQPAMSGPEQAEAVDQAGAGNVQPSGSDVFRGARTASSFLTGASRYGAEHGSAMHGNLLAGAKPVARDAGGLSSVLSAGLSQAGPTLAGAGMFTNRRAGSPNEGLVGQVVQLADGRKASVYFTPQGKRRIVPWAKSARTGGTAAPA